MNITDYNSFCPKPVLHNPQHINLLRYFPLIQYFVSPTKYFLNPQLNFPFQLRFVAQFNMCASSSAQFSSCFCNCPKIIINSPSTLHSWAITFREKRDVHIENTLYVLPYKLMFIVLHLLFYILGNLLLFCSINISKLSYNLVWLFPLCVSFHCLIIFFYNLRFFIKL